MSKKLRPLLILAMIGAVCGCDVFSSNRFQYFKYAIEISLLVDGVSVTGRSVQELRAEAVDTPFFANHGVISKVRGLAVVLERPSGGAVMALMKLPNGQDGYEKLVLSQCGLGAKPEESPTDWANRIGQFSGECVLTPPAVPLLVWIPSDDSPSGTTIIEMGAPQFGSNTPTLEWIGGVIKATEDPMRFEVDPRPQWLQLLPTGSPPIEVRGGGRLAKLLGHEFKRERF